MSTGGPDQPVALLRGVDRGAFAVALGDRLRVAGVPVTFTALGSLTDALALASVSGVDDLYWRCRVTLLSDVTHLGAFDAVFDAAFRDTVRAVDPRADGPVDGPGQDRAPDIGAPVAGSPSEDGDGLPWHTRPRAVAAEEGPADGVGVPELLPTAVAALADVPFDELDEAQLAVVEEWLEEELLRWPTRRSRRRRVHPSGRRVALRETVAASRRTGWEPLRLARTRPVLRPRPLTMVTDVSASMQPYASTYLHLMRALARSGRAETFAFSTSLTRLTPALRHRSAREAMALATDAVQDRYGGTQLAGSLRTLLVSRHGNVLRGGVLVIASDGWDSDDPARLAAVLARVRLRAHRVVWLNPRVAAPGFQPLVASMAAALPFCDALLPAHTVNAVTDALDAILAGAGS
jgi:uncharacterized protein with von Willebrand factor type A (vWA) domain